MASPTINFITWNVNGLKQNRDQKFQELQNADIVFLQETHIGTGDEHLEDYKDEWYIYFTKYTSCSKGTAILVSRRLEFEHISDEKDNCGTYVVLKCKLKGQPYTLVSVYNHETDTKTLDKLSSYLQSMTTGMLVIGGDFNTVLNPFIDKKFNTSKKIKNGNQRKLLLFVKKFMKSLQLVDVWRRKNPIKQDYTYYIKESPVSRLDYFFVPEECMWRVRSCDIRNSERPDHWPVSLEINNIPTMPFQKYRQIKTIFQWLNLKQHLFTDEAGSSLGEESSQAVSEVDIFSAVNSLQVSDTPRPDGIPVSFYKDNIQDLIQYIKMLYDRIHSGAFNCSEKHFNETVKSPHDNSQHFFNVDYLIIATILAKRLGDYLESQSKDHAPKDSATVMITPKTFCTEMRLSHIQDEIEKQKRSNPNLYQDFLIVKNLLRDAPEVDTESVAVSIERDKLLDQGCPLTPVLIMLALKCFGSALAGHLKQHDILVFKDSVILCIQPEDLEKVLAAVRERANEVFYIEELYRGNVNCKQLKCLGNESMAEDWNKRLTMYAVVTLQDSDEVMVVASNWLSLDKKQCYWPPFRSPDKCMEAVQNRIKAETGGKPWEKLNISFHRDYVTFEKAKEEQQEIKERKERPYLLATGFPGMLKRQRLECPQEMLKQQLPPAPSASTSRMSADDKDELLQTLRDIKSTVQQNSAMLKKLLKDNAVSEVPSSTSIPHKDVKTNLKLPLRTIKDVARTERQLTKNATTRQKYVRYLSRLGGFGQKDVIKNIMQHVLTDDLATKFNWQGRGNKKPFSKLILTDVIREAASKQSVTRIDCEAEIKNYLWSIADRISRNRPRDCGGVTSDVTSPTLLDSGFQSVSGMSFD
ncbi:uncharacterized protein LOC107670006 isoform X1 [Sinocyclocheilus anshuiensis]|uniref:uncharacterized protein LOC107670006 isoform X1 n=1 Tax=Sinocyclocheilus anshuiensis TaxID=1608454 RepID=UPI0007B87D67|nr:PREDICTED: uncharacterized protein LOC107670006 isoform X1 [Sinocyclocheilus anshuiensis]